MAGFRILVRSGAKVRRERTDNLDAALSVLERHGRQLEGGASAADLGGTLIRRYEPVQQVVGRVELRGPGRVRVGVDVRGDGSAEAFTGRVRRRLVEQRENESPYEALRRELSA
ncbi:MAG TPA: hypothetical protein VFD31_08240 [Thermoleophilaceae bacterium]|nr:hypothetical protein [Thermoleophilaceae bacterium]